MPSKSIHATTDPVEQLKAVLQQQVATPSTNSKSDYLSFIEVLKAVLAKRVEVHERAQYRLLSIIQVRERLGISRAALYQRLDPNDPAYDANFPIPIRVGARAVRWIESEVDAYIASLPRARRIGDAA